MIAASLCTSQTRVRTALKSFRSRRSLCRLRSRWGRNRWVSTSRRTARVYVANSLASKLSVVDLTQRVELRKINVPSGFSNDTPYSIAIAANGLAPLSTTFGGRGFGARMLQLNLATDAVTERTDFFISGTTTERTQLAASGDRSTIGVVAGDISSGPIFKYSRTQTPLPPKGLGRLYLRSEPGPDRFEVPGQARRFRARRRAESERNDSTGFWVGGNAADPVARSAIGQSRRALTCWICRRF